MLHKKVQDFMGAEVKNKLTGAVGIVTDVALPESGDMMGWFNHKEIDKAEWEYLDLLEIQKQPKTKIRLSFDIDNVLNRFLGTEAKNLITGNVCYVKELLLSFSGKGFPLVWCIDKHSKALHSWIATTYIEPIKKRVDIREYTQESIASLDDKINSMVGAEVKNKLTGGKGVIVEIGFSIIGCVNAKVMDCETGHTYWIKSNVLEVEKPSGVWNFTTTSDIVNLYLGAEAKNIVTNQNGYISDIHFEVGGNIKCWFISKNDLNEKFVPIELIELERPNEKTVHINPEEFRF